MEFRIIPPPPAFPELSKEDPSEFRLNQFSGGGSERTLMELIARFCLSFSPRNANPKTLANVSVMIGLRVLWSLKITLFHRSHKLQTPKGKIIPQLMPIPAALWEVQLVLSQSSNLS